MTVLRRQNVFFVAAWGIFVAYVLAARGVRNFFPISAFDMYQARAPTIACRILVAESSGKTFEITQYEAFKCNPSPPKLADTAHCGFAEFGRADYVLRDQQIFLDEHLRQSVEGGVDAKLVWRAYSLENRPGPPGFTDCELATCTVRRKGAAP